MKASIFFCLVSPVFYFFDAKAQEFDSRGLDKRAHSRYSAEQIALLSPLKIKQINFLYSKSFFVAKKDKPCAGCPEVDITKIDITKFDNKRLHNQRAVVYESEPGYPIILLSSEEIKNEFNKIESEAK